MAAPHNTMNMNMNNMNNVNVNNNMNTMSNHSSGSASALTSNTSTNINVNANITGAGSANNTVNSGGANSVVGGMDSFVMLAKSQAGSRLLQTKLSTADPLYFQTVFNDVYNGTQPSNHSSIMLSYFIYIDDEYYIIL